MSKIFNWFNKSFPQNFIVQKPMAGSLIFFVFCFGFVNIYRPLNAHEGKYFNFAVTMAVYFLLISLFVFGIIKIIKRWKFFSKAEEWTFLKELISVILILAITGVVIYFMGFFIEVPSLRWNLPTFFDSLKNAFLIGIIPFGFFTLVNYRHLFVTEIIQDFKITETNGETTGDTEERIQIGSRLKKEELSFFPGQFIFAESDGNYVVFHLVDEKQTQKHVIRNSISEIEQQLSSVPYFTRTHRAFIVNVKKVISKKGNTLGYRLKLTGLDSEIPVSRQNIQAFDKVLKQCNYPSVTKNYHS